MNNEWLISKLRELNESESCNEIRNQISAINDERIISIILTSSGFLNKLDKKSPPSQSVIAFEILKACLTNMNLLDQELPYQLESCLQHKNAEVPVLTLNEIYLKLKTPPILGSNAEKLSLIIIPCLDAIETEIAAVAIQVLSILLVECIDNPSVMQSLLLRQQKDSLIRLRFYEIIVNLGKISPLMIEKVQSVLDDMLSELQNDDVLFQLNILELLTSLAEREHGLKFLEDRKALEVIGKRISEVDRNSLDELLLPGFFKFFSKIGYEHPKKIIVEYPIVVKTILSSLLAQDFSMLPTIFDNIANLAHSADGKILLDKNFEIEMRDTFHEFASVLRNLSLEIRIRAFNALECIFRQDGGNNIQTEQITAKWCSYLTSSNDLQFILEICNTPFPEIKTACLSFVKMLCSYNWGINAIKNTAGLVEYLLDRTVEFNKDVHYLKYEINSILSESIIFDASVILMLKRYVGEGPYFVEGIVDIAVEGSN